MKRLPFCLTAISLLLTSALSHAAEPRALSLDECLDLGLTSSPAMRAARLSVESARILQGTAFDPAPTDVEFGQETTTGASLDNGFNFGQEFDFPTLYFARHKALKAETAVAESSLRADERQLAADITAAYYNMLYTRRVYDLRLELDTTFRSFSSIANSRYTEGQTSRLEQINARRYHESNHLLAERARTDYLNACAQMQRLIGSDVPVAPKADSFGVIPHTMPEATVDYASTPAGQLSERRIELGKRNLTVAKQSFLPGLSVGVTTQLVIKSFNPYHVEREPFEPGNFLGFSVGLKVPLFFGATRARARSARREVEMQQELYRKAEAETQADYRAALDEYAACRRLVDYYETTGLNDAAEITRLSKVSYDLNEIDYLEHIHNLDAAIGIEIEYADAVNSLNNAIIKIQTLQGK